MIVKILGYAPQFNTDEVAEFVATWNANKMEQTTVGGVIDNPDYYLYPASRYIPVMEVMFKFDISKWLPSDNRIYKYTYNILHGRGGRAADIILSETLDDLRAAERRRGADSMAINKQAVNIAKLRDFIRKNPRGILSVVSNVELVPYEKSAAFSVLYDDDDSSKPSDDFAEFTQVGGYDGYAY